MSKYELWEDYAWELAKEAWYEGRQCKVMDTCKICGQAQECDKKPDFDISKPHKDNVHYYECWNCEIGWKLDTSKTKSKEDLATPHPNPVGAKRNASPRKQAAIRGFGRTGAAK